MPYLPNEQEDEIACDEWRAEQHVRRVDVLQFLRYLGLHYADNGTREILAYYPRGVNDDFNLAMDALCKNIADFVEDIDETEPEYAETPADVLRFLGDIGLGFMYDEEETNAIYHDTESCACPCSTDLLKIEAEFREFLLHGTSGLDCYDDDEDQDPRREGTFLMC